MPLFGLIHHSDQGGHVSLAFGRAVREAGIAVSMGFRGDDYDNAVAETFFATLKKELVKPPQLAVAARAPIGGVRVHRGVLQPPAPALHPRDALPGRLRTTTTLSARWLRSIARTTSININTRVSRKLGQVQATTHAFAVTMRSRRPHALYGEHGRRPASQARGFARMGRCRVLDRRGSAMHERAVAL